MFSLQKLQTEGKDNDTFSPLYLAPPSLCRYSMLVMFGKYLVAPGFKHSFKT